MRNELFNVVCVHEQYIINCVTDVVQFKMMRNFCDESRRFANDGQE